MNELLQRVAERVQDSMDEILTSFKAGAKITVLVRTPDKPTADFCLTSDDLDEVIAMVQRRKGDTPSPQLIVGGRRYAPITDEQIQEIMTCGGVSTARIKIARLVHNETMDDTAKDAEIARLRRMVERRDEFIIGKSFWNQFKEVMGHDQ